LIWDKCCKCGNPNTIVSFNGKFPLCLNCYRLWEDSKENQEFKQEILGKGRYKEAEELFDAYHKKWLGVKDKEKEVVQFT
jgi:hypothetical protein